MANKRSKGNNLNLRSVQQYVENNISVFHNKRIESLNSLKLNTILKRKNPYLYKAKNILTTGDIVKNILDAHLSSQEETIFGDWLEGLAIFINQQVYGGKKSGITGIDLEFEKDNIRYIITIKSGPKWGNSSQIEKMKDNFRTALKTLRTSNSKIHVIAVNGCCYGKDKKPNKGDYYKYCGQEFWEFISGDQELYLRIIEPLSTKAKEKNDEFLKAYSRIINKFTQEFSKSFCNADMEIDWEKIVKFNSSKA
ncbi:MAG: cytosolic protein [Bacteroidia bacterium]|jgi:hypothetical protein|nr:cytosolic protein [Bacteroidia bacterium]